MSTPMYDMPEHVRMGLTVDNLGPVMEWESDFDHWGCWCGRPNCREWEANRHE